MNLNAPTVVFATACLLVSSALIAAPGGAGADARPLMFGKVQAFGIWDLPRSRIRKRLESLPFQARERGLNWLNRFEFPAADLESIRIDDEGGVLYAEPVPNLPEFAPGHEQGADVDGGFPELAGAAADDAFVLHSRPNAQNVLYLDFDGHVITGTAWNSSHDPLYAEPFDLDGDPTSFNDAERAAIAEIWHRVAEDFAPFDIDVTTEEPLNFDAHTGRVLITSETDADGKAMPYNTGGGVAYVGVWGLSNYATKYSPAFVYYDNLGKGTTYIAEASSHEFGHNLGLSHDGTSSTAYYQGHGSGYTSWAPIMGNSYYNNVTQWSKGEYAGANNTQDDIAVVASALSLAGDDHGNSRSTATPLSLNSNGDVLVSDPETDPQNLYPENKGVIDSASDWDYFSFDAADGTVDLTVRPSWQAFYRSSRRGANLDVRAVLFDANGSVLAESDPTSDTYASVSAAVTQGTYFLGIQGVGNSNYSTYASQGQYFISGAVASEPNTPPTAGFSFACAALTCNFVDTSGDTDGSVTGWSWEFGDGNTSTAQNPNHTYAAGGSYTVTLTVTDDDGASDAISKTVTIIAEPPNAAPDADFSYSCTELGCSFSDLSNDTDGSIVSWSWDFGDGVTSTLQSPSHGYAGSGSYTVTLTVTDDDGASDSHTQGLSVSTASVQDDVFSDDFDDGTLAPWSQLQSGKVAMVQDPTYGWVLRKTANNDPHGGWAPLGSTFSDFDLVLFARKVNTDGGSLVRYSLTDGSGNGYGMYLDYRNGDLSIERRSKWSGKELAASVGTLPGGMQLGQWYTLRLTRSGTQLTAEAYIGRVDASTASPTLSVAAADSLHTSFSQVNVNGGREFDTDDVRVQAPGAAVPLAVATTTLSNAIVGNAYSATLQASGGTQPYSWSLAGGSLPAGLSLSADGALSGTPGATGVFNFTVEVTDQDADTATQALSLTVDSAGTQTGVFSDDFDDGTLAPWSQLKSGKVEMVQDPTYGWVLRKTTNNDPHGGWAPLGGIFSDFELVLFARKVNTNGGDLVRYSVTDGSGNGYGVYLDYRKGDLTVERRSRWNDAELDVSGGTLPGGMQLGQWYTLRLTRVGAQLTAEAYVGRVDPNTASPTLSAAAVDSVYTSFSQVNVNGGRDFDTDNVEVRKK